MDLWAVVDESVRAQWDYAPRERVGPLHFGMSPQEAAAAMEPQGFTFDGVSEIGKLGPVTEQCMRFRAVRAPRHRGDVTAYYVGPVGLACIAVDALTGPQVTVDGIRLVGRPLQRWRLSSSPTWRRPAGTSCSPPKAMSVLKRWGYILVRSEPGTFCLRGRSSASRTTGLTLWTTAFRPTNGMRDEPAAHTCYQNVIRRLMCDASPTADARHIGFA